MMPHIPLIYRSPEYLPAYLRQILARLSVSESVQVMSLSCHPIQVVCEFMTLLVPCPSSSRVVPKEAHIVSSKFRLQAPTNHQL